MKVAKKIYILGQSGTGKTTLALNLSKKSNIQLIELDVYWHKLSGDREIFRQEILKLIRSDAWIAEGKHKTVRDDLITQADKIIYLDLPLWHSVFFNIKRAFVQKESILKFIKHLLKVIKEFYSVKTELKSQLKSHQDKLVTLKSLKEVKDYLNYF